MSEYGIIGDQFVTELPQTIVPAQDLSEEKAKAKFSRTKEFAVLKNHLEERIKYYQTYLPNGDAVIGENLSLTLIGEKWLVANAVIAELQLVIASYERANETIKELKDVR